MMSCAFFDFLKPGKRIALGVDAVLAYFPAEAVPAKAASSAT